MIIPLSTPTKTTVDVATVSGAVAGFFSLIPWPGIAAFFAAVYTALRIVEMVWSWWKKRAPGTDS